MRPLGKSGLMISTIGLGCWPMAGLTSPGATREHSLATIRACFELGINHLDTAHMYGREGESEQYVAAALGRRRREMIIATKGGLRWSDAGEPIRDATAATLRRQCEESLARLQTDYIDLYYLHAPDPHTPVAESAGAIARLIAEGKVRCAGASNTTVAELEEFTAVCPLAAYQPLYNMLQREIEADALPWCRQRGVAVLPYWVLLKGLLAGKLARSAVFPPGDSRLKYPMFQGLEWQRNHDLVDRLRAIAAHAGCTVAQLVIAWTLSQPGITAALCGAKRPDQIGDNAGAMACTLSDAVRAEIAAALAARGTPQSQRPA